MLLPAQLWHFIITFCAIIVQVIPTILVPQCSVRSILNIGEQLIIKDWIFSDFFQNLRLLRRHINHIHGMYAVMPIIMLAVILQPKDTNQTIIKPSCFRIWDEWFVSSSDSKGNIGFSYHQIRLIFETRLIVWTVWFMGLYAT